MKWVSNLPSNVENLTFWGLVRPDPVKVREKNCVWSVRSPRTPLDLPDFNLNYEKTSFCEKLDFQFHLQFLLFFGPIISKVDPGKLVDSFSPRDGPVGSKKHWVSVSWMIWGCCIYRRFSTTCADTPKIVIFFKTIEQMGTHSSVPGTFVTNRH